MLFLSLYGPSPYLDRALTVSKKTFTVFRPYLHPPFLAWQDSPPASRALPGSTAGRQVHGGCRRAVGALPSPLSTLHL